MDRKIPVLLVDVYVDRYGYIHREYVTYAIRLTSCKVNLFSLLFSLSLFLSLLCLLRIPSHFVHLAYMSILFNAQKENIEINPNIILLSLDLRFIYFAYETMSVLRIRLNEVILLVLWCVLHLENSKR